MHLKGRAVSAHTYVGMRGVFVCLWPNNSPPTKGQDSETLNPKPLNPSAFKELRVYRADDNRTTGSLPPKNRQSVGSYPSTQSLLWFLVPKKAQKVLIYGFGYLKRPKSPNLWFLVPKTAKKSYNNIGHLDP